MDTIHRISSLLHFVPTHPTFVGWMPWRRGTGSLLHRLLLQRTAVLSLGTILLLTGMVGCRPDTVCRQDIQVLAGVTTEWVLTDTAGNTTPQVTWDSVSVWGVGNDSLLYDNTYAVETLALPLRIDTTMSAFVILWHGTYDTLYIHHDNTRKFISSACGCAVYHTLDTTWVAGTFVDSLYIVNSSVETVQQTNIHLRLR